MTGFNVNAALGIADEEHVIWPSTRAAIERTGYGITPAPGQPTPKLGEGAFATVFYAEHALNKRAAAIKVFHTEEADLLESFRRESKTVEGPEFPRQFAVETYLSCYEPGTQPFLVLEYICGQPLDEYVTDHKPPREVRIELIERLLTGVQALHERNITHRDLSWRNVLVDQRGLVRLLDFGEAGEIVRAQQQTTLRNPRGNRECSPGEQVRGDIRAGKPEDIFNCAMIAVYVLTGKAPPSNADAASGDPQHLAACRKQLREAGVPGSLTRIVVGGLRDVNHRYRLARKMAEDMFDHRVRRPQRRRTWLMCLALLAMCLAVAGVGWWRYAQSQQALALAQYHALKRQASEMKYANDPTVARRLQEVRQLEDAWSDQALRGEGTARETLGRIKDLLDQTIRINAGLERSHPRREALGTALQAMRWVAQSQVIQTRKLAAEAAYKAINDLLAAGKTDEAWTRLDALQQDVAELTRENALAALAADAQRQYELLEQSLSDRLRALPAHQTIADLAQHGQQAWEAGDWELAQRDYGQARQRLDELLKREETVAERAAREKAGLEALQLVEQERQRLQGEISRLTAERDQQQQRARGLETQVTDLNKQWLADRAQLDRANESLKTTRDQKTALMQKAQQAEQTAQQQAATIQQLTRDKAALDAKATELEKQTAELATLKQDLAQAQAAARTAAEQLAVAQRQLASRPTAAAASTPAATVPQGKPPSLKPGPTQPLEVWKNSLGMEFVSVPAGEFDMGAGDDEADSLDDERPRHRVRISRGFLVSRHEMTQQAFEQVLGFNPSYFSAQGEGREAVRGLDTSQFPVETVTWFDAIACANKLSEKEGRTPHYRITNPRLDSSHITAAEVAIGGGDGYRLLTEAEWEYVARAGTSTVFPWGDSLSSDQANFDGNQPYGGAAQGKYLQRTTTVASYAPNPWGLYDAAGNVWEWVWDWYDSGYYGQLGSTTAVDPAGPSQQAAHRVLRGGSWRYVGGHCRPAARYRGVPGGRYRYVGFRLALGRS